MSHARWHRGGPATFTAKWAVADAEMPSAAASFGSRAWLDRKDARSEYSILLKGDKSVKPLSKQFAKYWQTLSDVPSCGLNSQACVCTKYEQSSEVPPHGTSIDCSLPIDI